MEENASAHQVISSTAMTAVLASILMTARYGEFVTRSVRTDRAVTSASVKKGISWSAGSTANPTTPSVRPPLSSLMVGIC